MLESEKLKERDTVLFLVGLRRSWKVNRKTIALLLLHRLSSVYVHRTTLKKDKTQSSPVLFFLVFLYSLRFSSRKQNFRPWKWSSGVLEKELGRISFRIDSFLWCQFSSYFFHSKACYFGLHTLACNDKMEHSERKESERVTCTLPACAFQR